MSEAKCSFCHRPIIFGETKTEDAKIYHGKCYADAIASRSEHAGETEALTEEERRKKNEQFQKQPKQLGEVTVGQQKVVDEITT